MPNKQIQIYTDGSCIGNPGPGGYGAIILYENKKIKLKGRSPDTTNNRMEMMAMIKSIEYLHKNGLAQEDITLYSDSNLLIQSLTKNWKRKKNLDLWAKLDKQRAWLNIKWVWVKAHAHHAINNEVDRLALSEAKKQNSLL